MTPLWSLALVWFCVLAASDGGAQESYPAKPVRIVVDSAAGSANDATARILADKLGKLWK
jgi:tripartite-type tricarboxylate transporter receptor subunit TctC